MFVVVDPIARIRPARYALGDRCRGNLVVVLIRWTGQRRRVPFGAHLRLDVLADTPEATDVARDQRERDGEQHIVHVALLADRVDVDLYPDVPLEHGWPGATTLVLHPEGHRRKHAVRQLGHRQKGMNQMGFDRRQRLSLDEHRKRFVLLGGHQVTEPGLFRQLGRRFRCKVHFFVGNLKFPPVEFGATEKTILDVCQPSFPQLATGVHGR